MDNTRPSFNRARPNSPSDRDKKAHDLFHGANPHDRLLSSTRRITKMHRGATPEGHGKESTNYPAPDLDIAK
jgi:hypothetical protein